jgi:hypothetical protein
VRTEAQALGLPGAEVVAHVDGTTHTLALPHRPVLVKGAGALDGRLVDTRALGDRIGATVGLDCAQLGRLRRGVVVAE